MASLFYLIIKEELSMSYPEVDEDYEALCDLYENATDEEREEIDRGFSSYDDD